MNRALFFTACRFAASPVMFFLYMLPNWANVDSPNTVVVRIALLWVVFAVAEISDALDGIVARTQNIVTDFGKLADPLADIMFNLTLLFCLAQSKIIPNWCFIIIFQREILVTLLRMRGLLFGVAIPARWPGKWKSVSYIITIIVGLFAYSATYANIEQDTIDFAIRSATWLAFISVLWSLFSFCEHLIRSRNIKESQSS